MTRNKRRHYRIKMRSMYQWHRYVGISIALFIILLSTTGILLNHTEFYKLDEHYVKSEWLLDWYGIEAPAQIRSYRVENYWLAQWQNRLFLDKKDLGNIDGDLKGVVMHKDVLFIALQGGVMLFTLQGELIEKLGHTNGLPEVINAIGINSYQQPVLKTPNGFYQADDQLVNYQPVSGNKVSWSEHMALPENVYEDMLSLYRGKGLTMERVILDLHSGRLFSGVGVYLMDIVALLMIFLAVSGGWIWAKRILRERKRLH